VNKKKRVRTVWNKAKFFENMAGLLLVLSMIWVAVSFIQTAATNIHPDIRREPVWWNLIDLFLKYAPKNF